MAIVFNPFTGNFDFTGSGGSSGLTVGTTTITSGTSGRILYDNSGVLGEATVTGTLGSVVLSTAPTLTGPVTLNEAVGSSGLTITGATQTTSQPALNITQTWNGAGVTFSLIKGLVTLTAYTSPSYLLNLQAGTSPYGSGGGHFRVTQLGALEFGNANSSNSTISLVSSGKFDFNGAGIQTNANAQFAKLILSYANGDVILERDAANTLALRNSTNAQTFRVYNTYTDASNYERLAFNWSSNTATITTEASGTGTIRTLRIGFPGESSGAASVVSAPTQSGTSTLRSTTDFLLWTSTTTQVPSNGAARWFSGGSWTATSGTNIGMNLVPSYAPTSTSTMVAIPLQISPTINYAAGTPGAGSYEALKIAAVETALPTGSNYLIRASSGATGFTDRFLVDAAVGAVTGCAGTAIPAGGTTGAGLKVSSTANFGVFFGSGAPSLSAAKGSLYLRSDGSGTTDRAYVNTDGGTTWTAITTSA